MKNGICKIKWNYYDLNEQLIAVCVATTRYEAITYFEDAKLDVMEQQHSVRFDSVIENTRKCGFCVKEKEG
jgi:hypothetical protein